MLCEISQTEKDKYCMLSIMHEQQKIQQTNEHNRKEAETSGYQWVGKGTIGIGKWWIQTIRFKLGYKNVFVVQGIQPTVCNNQLEYNFKFINKK